MLLARRLACFMVTAAIAGSGCSRGDGDVNTLEDAASSSPCSLVKKPEVEAALGRFVADGTAWTALPDIVGEEACQFKAPGGKATDIPIVKVGVVRAYGPIVFSRYRAQNAQAVAVPELGREAVWNDTTSTLVVLSGDQVVTVVLYGQRARQDRERAVELAKKALGRL